MILGSYTYPLFIEIDDEPMENLVAFKPEELRPKMIKKGDPEFESVGQRLLRRAVEAVDACPHNWGMTHFWRNPKMLPPCQVTKIEGVWYRRKDCSFIDLNEVEGFDFAS